MYGNILGDVRSAAIAKASIFQESKVGSNVLEWYLHLVSKKTKTIKIVVRAVKAYISKSMPTYVRFSRGRSHIISSGEEGVEVGEGKCEEESEFKSSPLFIWVQSVSRGKRA